MESSELHSDLQNPSLPVEDKQAVSEPPIVSLDCLPSELLVSIFSIACADSHTVPVVLSHTSSRWRDVTLNTSVLWTKIVILGGEKAILALLSKRPQCTPPNGYSDSMKDTMLETQRAHRIILERASAFLDRSRTALVDFVFDLGNLGGAIGGYARSHTSSLETLLTSNLHRARSLDGASLASREWASIFLIGHIRGDTSGSQMALHRLTDLKLTSILDGRGTRSWLSLPLHPSLLSAEWFPNLRSVTLNHFALLSHSVLILQHVRYFTWISTSHDFSDIIRHLASAPHIRQFVLSNSKLTLDVIPDGTEPKLTLESLRTFEWASPLPQRLDFFFLQIATPNLEELTISLRNLGRSSELYRSPITLYHLKSLTLDLVQDTESSFSCLYAFLFPSLVSFHLSTKIGVSTDQGPLLPLPAIDSIFHETSMLGLRTLSFKGFKLRYTRALSFLRCLTRLSALYIESCSGVDRIMRDLAADPGVCPELTEVHLRKVVIEEERKLIRLIAARAEPRTELVRVLAPLPSRVIKPLEKQADAQMGSQPKTEAKEEVAMQRIRRLYLVKCKGVGELAQEWLRTTVDDFVYI